jgi:hypothetical protein
MKAWYVDRVRESASRTCTRCGHSLAWVEDVGWVDASAETYDMCEADPYGNHEPGQLLD